MEVSFDKAFALRTNAYHTFGDNYQFVILGNSLGAKTLEEGLTMPDLNCNGLIFKVITAITPENVLNLKKRVEKEKNKTGLPQLDYLELMLKGIINRFSFEQDLVIGKDNLSVLNWVYDLGSLESFCSNKEGARIKWPIKIGLNQGLLKPSIKSYDLRGREIEVPISLTDRNGLSIGEIPSLAQDSNEERFYGEIRYDFLTNPAILLPYTRVVPTTPEEVRRKKQTFERLRNATWNAALSRAEYEIGETLPIDTFLNLFPEYVLAKEAYLQDCGNKARSSEPKLRFPGRIINYILTRTLKEGLKHRADEQRCTNQ